MMSPYRFDPALVEPLERARLSAFLYHLLQRSAAANAVIGVAHHPGRSSSCARDDPVRPFVTVCDESGARRRLPCAACRGGIRVSCPNRPTPQRNRRPSESHHVPSSLPSPPPASSRTALQ